LTREIETGGSRLQPARPSEVAACRERNEPRRLSLPGFPALIIPPSRAEQ